MKKEDILAKLLIENDKVKDYVILCNDISGKYIKYAFADGYPADCYKLPVWISELPVNDGAVYELSGFTGEHWCFKDSKPVDVQKLFEKKFNMSTNDIVSLIESISKK